MVSSTTPRFGPMWPPLRAVTSISSSRISCASCGSSAGARALTSAGPAMRDRRVGTDEELLIGNGTHRRLFRAGGFEGLKGGGAVLGLFQLLDLEFGLLETALADLQEFAALFVFGQEF